MPQPRFVVKIRLKLTKPAYNLIDKRNETHKHGAVKVCGGGTYNHAGGLTDLAIHPYNAKQPLLQHLHDGIPPLDGQTLPDHRQKMEI